jgi:hypothetical protein
MTARVRRSIGFFRLATRMLPPPKAILRTAPIFGQFSVYLRKKPIAQQAKSGSDAMSNAVINSASGARRCLADRAAGHARVKP